MLTFVFLTFIAFGVVAGIVISVMAKKRQNGTAERPSSVAGDTPVVGRASGRGDD